MNFKPLRGSAPLTAALLALLGFAASPAAAATSQKEAQRTAIAALKLRESTAPVILFQQLRVVPRGTEIGQAGTTKPSNKAHSSATRDERLGNAGIAILEAPVVARTGRDAAWLFYEDQAPYEAYQHPGRVVLVNQRTGRVTITRQLSWPPLISGRLPEFLKGYPAYRAKRGRAFIRGRKLASTTIGASTQRSLFRDVLPDYSRLLRVDGANVESRKQAADQLAAEHSCAIRISDTLGDFYDAGPVDKTRAALGSLFNELARLNPGFYTARYRYRSGTTPGGFVDRAIRTEGCKNVLLYLAGGGYPAAADPAVNVGTRGRPDGRVEQQIVSASDLRATMRRHPGVTFNLEIDAPSSGAFLDKLKSERNLLILATSSTKGEGAFTALSDVLDANGAPVANAYNSEQLLEYTNRQLKGLECFLSSPAEVSSAAAAKAGGQTRSFFGYMLARAFRLCAAGSLADAVRGGPEPVLALLGGEAPPPAPSTNRSPTATPSSVATTEDTPVAVTLAGADPDGDPLTYAIVRFPANGIVSAGAYTPNRDASGVDSFTFTVSDGTTTSAPATVAITITAVNDAPVVTLGPATATFTEAGPPVAVDPAVVADDVDDPQLTGAVVDLGGGFASGQDALAFTNTAAITGAFDAATGALTLTGTASVADYQAALRSVTFDNTSANPSDADRTAEIRVSDGHADSATVSRRIAMAIVDDAPVLGGGGITASYTEDDTTGVIANPDLTVSDVDSANLASATVRISGGLVNAEDELVFVPANGITATYTAATGTLQLSGSASVGSYQAALRSVRYRNANTGQPSDADRTITFTAGASNSVTSDVTITRVDDAPTVSTGAGSPNFDEAGSAVAIAPSATVADADDADLDSATVSIGTGFDAADDRLLFMDTVTIDGDYDDVTGTLTLEGTDTVAAYQAALRTVAYDNIDNDIPSGATRTISFTATDGAPLTSSAATKDVTVTTINDAPVLGAGGTSVDYTEGDSSLVVNSAITVGDVDNADMAGATISFGTGFDAADDRLRFTDTATIEGDYNASTGVLTLTGADTKANYQSALRSIAYENVDTGNPGTTTRVVTFTVDDGALSSDPVTGDVTIEAVDDAPTVTAGSSAASFTESGSPVVVDATVTAGDVDDVNLVGATVEITGDYVDTEDVLEFVDADGITGAWVAGTATLTLTGSATLAQYQAALRTVTYRNSNTNAPSTTARTVTWLLDDGERDSTTATSTVAVVAVNTLPVLTATSGSTAFVEDAGAVAVDSGIGVADGDDADLEGAVVEITGNFQTGEDTLTFVDQNGITGVFATGTLTLAGSATKAQYATALRSIAYDNTSDTPDTGARTVSFTVDDGDDDSATVTRGLTVTAADDSPVVTLSGSTPDFTEAGSPVVVDAALTVADVDTANLASATVCVCTNRVNAEDELLFTPANGITATAYDAATGTITLTGALTGGYDTKAKFQAALRTIQYRNTNLTTPSSLTRGITFTVDDGSSDSADVTKDVTITTSNDPPVLGGGGNTVAYTEDDAATVVNGSITTADADDANLDGATIAITGGFDATEDQLTFANASPITGSYNATTGVLTLSGSDTKAKYQAALRTVKYVNNDHAAPSSSDRTISFTADDGEEDSDPVTTTVTIAQHADAPVLTAGTSNTNTFTENGSAVVVDNAITAGDVDSTDLNGATVSISAGGTSGDDLAFTDTADITGSYNAGTRVLTLAGTDTVADYQTALRTITFASTSDDPGASRTVSFQVTDGAVSNTATHAVTVTPVNDTPSLTAGGTLAYTESDAAAVIESSVVLTDDGATISGATVQLTTNYVNGEDVLSATGLPVAITGAFSATTGTYTLSGSATVANYQSALRLVRYVNTSEDPTTAARTVTFSATDSGTPGLTGSDTASITVTSVNDAPVADDESFSGAGAAIGNTSYVLDDPTDGGPDPVGPQKTVIGDILDGDTDAEGDTLSITPATVASNDGGSVTVQADGDFTFTPAAGTSCSDTSDFFDYTVTDGASPTPGTDTGRVTIAITDCVWYVNNQAVAGGSGVSGTPYDTLAEADAAASTTGAYIYVYEGDGTTTGLTGGVTLLANQRLVGAAESLTVAGTTLESGADIDRPAISGSVTLAAGNTVEGLAITTSAANAIDGGAGDASGTLDDLVLTPSGATGGGISLNGTSGTWNVSDTTITATTGAQGVFASSAGTVNFASAGTISVTAAGPAVSLLSTTVSGTIDTTTSSGGSYGWALNAVTGALDLGTGTVSGHTSTEVSVTAGTGDVTYAGTLGNGTGTTAVVQNRTTGAITLSGNITDSNDAGGGITMSGNSGGSTTFSGSTKTLNTGSSGAVSLAFTGGHTVSFTGGGLDIDTTSGSGIASSSANGFVAVTGTGNTIDVSAGTAGTKGLNLNGPDITASGLTFQRISTTAADDGILLANTGNAGGLTVTGTGTSGSGGVITTSTGPGISLSSTRDISLSGVNVTNGGDDGIRATSVTNLSIAGSSGTGLASSITGNGNAGGENGFDLTELAGVVTITNATVTGNYDNNVALTNDAATLSNFTIDDGSYGSTNSTGGNDSIQIVNTGTGNLTGTIKNTDFMDSRGDHIQLITDNDPTTTSTQNMTIQNNTLNSTALSSTVLGGGIALGAGGGANQTVTVDNNDIDHAHGAPMSFNTTSGTSPTTHWTVNNNRIGNTGEVKSGSVANSGLYINVNGNGSANFLITNNTIMQTDFTAVDAVQNDGNAAMNITMKGNQLTEPGTTIDYAYGVRFVIGSADGDNGTSCLDLGDPATTALKNRFFGAGNSSQGYQDFRLRMAGDATANLVGYAGGLHDNAAVNSWLQTRNNIGGTPTTSSSQFDADSEYGTAVSCPT